MRVSRIGWFVAASFALTAACSSSNSGSGPIESCTKDADCPSGQACKPETGDPYCAPLCTSDGACPTQQQCTGSTDLPKQECKEIGSHAGGSGVCDLFNGSYGPVTCSGGTAHDAGTTTTDSATSSDTGSGGTTTTSCGVRYQQSDCASCVTTSCCAPERACAADPGAAGCGAFIACFAKCGSDTTCQNACIDPESNAAATLANDWLNCLLSSCSLCTGHGNPVAGLAP
jgi:hypothetical protein